MEQILEDEPYFLADMDPKMFENGRTRASAEFLLATAVHEAETTEFDCVSPAEHAQQTSLEDAVDKSFRQNVKRLPLDYGTREFIRWSVQRGWIHNENKKTSVRIPLENVTKIGGDDG